MKRREFIELIVGAAVTRPLSARAQPTGTILRAAFLGGASTPGGKALVEVLEICI
jgi:hypothetical protein